MSENGNGHRPSLADARAMLASADIPELPAPDDRVCVSEYAVLGAVIQSARVAMEAAAVLSPHHFADGGCALVFEIAVRLAESGQDVEPGTVLSELFRTGNPERAQATGLGSAGAFLHSLMERAGSVAYHAPRVLAGWHQRHVAVVLKSCGQIAGSPGFDLDEHMDAIRQRVMDATAVTGSAALRPNSETVTEVLDALESKADPGLTTGYRDLDDAIGGLRPGELVIVGARPGSGKTLLAGCIADHVGTRLGLPVLFSSLEMTEEELTQRRIAAAARVPLHHIVRHQVTDPEWDRIARVIDRLTETGLYVDDTSQASLAHIRGRLRVMTRTGNAARLLVIDYLGYMAPPKAESRQQAVAELARQVKGIAREFAIPVILLAQLNRGPEARSDKRPVPADLRESGEVEQSADIILLLYREDARNPESPKAGEIDVMVTKNRQGPLCTVTLTFQGHYGRIVSMASADGDPDAEWSPSSSLKGAQ